MDWIGTLLATALATTLLAFAFGFIPYPFGWIVLTLLLATRVQSLRRNGGH